MHSATELVPRPPHRPALGGLVLALLLGVVVSVALVHDSDTGTPLEPLGKPAAELVLGTYELESDSVTDGDSLRVPGVGAVRVIGIDCEEVFRSAARRADAESGFDRYARSRRGDSPIPVKYGTPAGEAASDAARELVAAAGRVRLERDDANASDVDGHGRTLAHVVLLAPSGEVLLAEALIEQGHSPYFVKYGRSRRFDRRLAHAERLARRDGRGIWSETGPDHYPDYDERLTWWHTRAAQVDRWRAAADAPGHVGLEDADAAERLRELVGQEATVFGVLRARKEKGVPRILWLRHAPRLDFAIVFFDLALWESLDFEALELGFLTVTGPITLHRDRPQILVEHATQIRVP